MWVCGQCGCQGVAASLRVCPQCGAEREDNMPKVTVNSGASNGWAEPETPDPVTPPPVAEPDPVPPPVKVKRPARPGAGD